MGKKKKGEGKEGGSNDNENKKKKDAGGGGGGQKGDGKKEDKKNKEEEEGIIVVLKMDMHCEGCANKILKNAKSIDGVDKAKADWEANKLTVLGDVDPSKIREDLQERTKKKVDLISPQLPKKEKAEEGGGNKGGGGDKKSQDKNSGEQKKPKEIPAITSVFKVELHCSGCIEKIQKIVSRTKGVEKVAFDRDKDLVAVTGRFNPGELTNVLSDKMKRSVQVVPSKKNDKDDVKGGGEKKDDKKGNLKDEEEEEDDDFDDDDFDDDDFDDDDEDYGYGGGDGFMEGRRVEYGGAQRGYYGGYPPPAHYGLLYGQTLHAPQMFSDENPNACSIM